MSKIALIGEAYGKDEEIKGEPFVGAAGHMLDVMLREANIDRASCFVSNVFNARPYLNEIDHFFIKNKEAYDKGISSPYPPFGTYGIVNPEMEHHIEKLYADLKTVNPNIVVALGNTALWALTHHVKITDYRGTVLMGLTGHKVLPTFHPAAVLRDYTLRAPVYADLCKALEESASPDIEVKDKKIWIATQTKDLDTFYNLFIKKADSFAYDVETNYTKREVTCISIAPSKNVALVIPFVKMDGTSYWDTTEQEADCWFWLLKLFADKSKKKIAHNAVYDLSYLEEYGVKSLGENHDTMLIHHSIQPELPKSLGWLSATYCNNPAWKHYRTQAKKEVNKSDD